MDRQKQLTQPERAFWRDVFVAVIPEIPLEVWTVALMVRTVQQAADLADAAVHEYRARILWRDRK